MSKTNERWLYSNDVARAPSTHQEDRNDDAEETDGAGENLDDEDLDEERRVLCVSERRARPDDADGDAAEEVREADRQTGGEHRVACMARSRSQR